MNLVAVSEIYLHYKIQQSLPLFYINFGSNSVTNICVHEPESRLMHDFMEWGVFFPALTWCACALNRVMIAMG